MVWRPRKSHSRPKGLVTGRRLPGERCALPTCPLCLSPGRRAGAGAGQLIDLSYAHGAPDNIASIVADAVAV